MMVTLIRPLTLPSWSTSSGEQGRCDSIPRTIGDTECYEATDPNCDCTPALVTAGASVCGDRNHGAGQDQASENTCELA